MTVEELIEELQQLPPYQNIDIKYPDSSRDGYDSGQISHVDLENSTIYVGF